MAGKKKQIITGIVVLFIFAGALLIWSQRGEKSIYQYPSTQGMHASEILDACRIPKETLHKMDAGQLAQAVVDFPLLIDVLTIDSTEAGMESLAEESDAYKELLLRDGAKEALLKKTREIDESGKQPDTVEMLKVILLREHAFANSFTEKERAYLQN